MSNNFCLTITFPEGTPPFQLPTGTGLGVSIPGGAVELPTAGGNPLVSFPPGSGIVIPNGAISVGPDGAQAAFELDTTDGLVITPPGEPPNPPLDLSATFGNLMVVIPELCPPIVEIPVNTVVTLPGLGMISLPAKGGIGLRRANNPVDLFDERRFD